jgi:hypothetical protein
MRFEQASHSIDERCFLQPPQRGSDNPGKESRLSRLWLAQVFGVFADTRGDMAYLRRASCSFLLLWCLGAGLSASAEDPTPKHQGGTGSACAALKSSLRARCRPSSAPLDLDSRPPHDLEDDDEDEPATVALASNMEA